MAGPTPIIDPTVRSRMDSAINTKFKPAKAPDTDKLKRACQDFEAIFVNQMFQQMRRTVSKDGLFDGGRAEEMFTSMQDAELAKSMSRQRGLGLADVMYRQLSGIIEQGQGDDEPKETETNNLKKGND